MNNDKKEMSSAQRNELINKLKNRFEKNMDRHHGIEWSKIQNRLEADAAGLFSLGEMEGTGGEPDVADYDKKTDEYIFYDCSPETPKGRVNTCYDPEALAARKANKPPDSAVGMAAEMGIEILTEIQYHHLQELGKFDLKTSSWLKTPENIRNLGGAIFGDRRYDTVFVYHNGAQSYYSARGFRGMLRV